MADAPRKREDRLRLSLGKVRVTVDLPSEKDGGERLPLTEWKLFTPTELRVIRLLVERHAMSREEIGTAIDESPEGRLKSVLASLTARRVLKVTESGYVLNVPPGGKKGLREWIKSYMGDDEEVAGENPRD